MIIYLIFKLNFLAISANLPMGIQLISNLKFQMVSIAKSYDLEPRRLDKKVWRNFGLFKNIIMSDAYILCQLKWRMLGKIIKLYQSVYEKKYDGEITEYQSCLRNLPRTNVHEQTYITDLIFCCTTKHFYCSIAAWELKRSIK